MTIHAVPSIFHFICQPRIDIKPRIWPKKKLNLTPSPSHLQQKPKKKGDSCSFTRFAKRQAEKLAILPSSTLVSDLRHLRSETSIRSSARLTVWFFNAGEKTRTDLAPFHGIIFQSRYYAGCGALLEDD